MIKRLDNISLSATGSESELFSIAEKSLKAKPLYFRILKKSLDARRKSDIRWIYSIEFGGDFPPAALPLELVSQSNRDRKILIIGSGPAGLFSALRLAQRGLCPIVIERGGSVDARYEAVNAFKRDGVLNTECNVQFGEGGAGTFSDGKLNTQTHNGYNAKVLSMFVSHGAPEEISYLNKPHIGSDKLIGVVKNMRREIERSGGEVRHNCKLVDIIAVNGEITKVRLESDGKVYDETADDVILAIGHSARDTFEMLSRRGIAMERREFAIGLRIEHLASDISASQYGNSAGLLPPADYKLVSNAGGRTAFTFCMCPGGYVMPASSEIGGIVTNGMSNYKRDNDNSNSALLVQVKNSDFKNDDLFAGVKMQRDIERAAYRHTNSYAAPVQKVGDFLKNRLSGSLGNVKPTYPVTAYADMRSVLPDFVITTLKAAIPDMAKKLRGFDSADALLTAPETRFSSPLRILRADAGMSVSIKNLYPCGEGSGYSGGITSSAADGLRIADLIFNKYK